MKKSIELRNLRTDETGVLPLIGIILGLAGVTAVSLVAVFFTKLFLTTLMVIVALVFLYVVVKFGKVKSGKQMGLVVVVFLGIIVLAFFFMSPLSVAYSGDQSTVLNTALLLGIGILMTVVLLWAIKSGKVKKNTLLLLLSVMAITLSVGGVLLAGNLTIGDKYDEIPIEDPVKYKFHDDRVEGSLILDASGYVNSWTVGELGETVTLDADLTLLRDPTWGETCHAIHDGWYELYTWNFRYNRWDRWEVFYYVRFNLNGYFTDGDTFEWPSLEWNVGNTIEAPSPSFQFKGSAEGGMKVELWVEYDLVNCAMGWVVESDIQKLVAEDTAYLWTGRGEIDWEKNLYQVGETARLKYDLGWSHSAKDPGKGGGWKIVFEALATGTSWDVDVTCDDCTGYVDVPVKAEYFGTGTPPDCPDNSLKAKLYNVLLPKDSAWTDVVDISSKAPDLKEVKVSDAPYITGETIYFEVIAEPGTTGGAIGEYYMRVDKTDESIKQDYGNFSYVPGSRGIWTFFFKVQDAFCRPSGETEIRITIYDPDEKIENGDEEDEVPWVLVLGLAITFLASIIAFNVEPVSGKVPVVARFGVPGLITLAVFLMIVQFGYGKPWISPLMSLMGV